MQTLSTLCITGKLKYNTCRLLYSKHGKQFPLDSYFLSIDGSATYATVCGRQAVLTGQNRGIFLLGVHQLLPRDPHVCQQTPGREVFQPCKPSVETK